MTDKNTVAVVEENRDYSVTKTGAIVLTNEQKYRDYQKRLVEARKKDEEIVSLRDEVGALKELINNLIESQKEK